MDEEQLKLLYAAMSKDFDIGDYNTFKSKMSTTDDRKKFYDAISTHADLGDYNQFEDRIGGKKKIQDSNVLPTPLDNGSKDGGSGLQLTPKDEIPLVDITGNGKTDVVGDPFELVKVAGDLDKKTEPIGFGMGVKEAPDMKAKKEAEGLYGQLTKEYGIKDPQNFYDETKGLTVHDYAKEGFHKEQLLEDRNNNNPVYHRKIARLKWSSGLEKALSDDYVNNKFDSDLGKNEDEYYRTQGIINNSLKGIDASDDYEQKRGNVQTIAKIIEQHGGDKKDELLKNLATETSIVYGKAAGENDEAFKANPLSKYLNPNQLAAYNFIQDTAPDKVDGYAAVFVDPKNIKDNFDATVGREEKLRRLDEIGLDLKTSYANENLNALGNQAKGLGIDGMQNTEPSNDPFSEIINNAKEESKGLNAKYPNASQIDAMGFAQELLGQKHTGLSWLGLEAGKATENTAKGIWDLVSEPFRSEEGSKIHQLETTGGQSQSELSTYLTQDKQTTKTFNPQISDQLKTEITAIKDNKDLTDKEKQSKVVDLLMNRPSEWQRTPIEGGKTNIGLTSLMYGIGGLAANLAPFMAMEALTGGGATAGAVRKFTSAFTSAAATGFHDAYAEALKEGVSNPYAQAMRVTAINSAAMAGAGTPDAIRKMLGSTKGAIGDLVGKMSDDEIMGALRHSPEALSTFQKAFNIGKKATTSLATGFKEGAKVSAFTTSGQAANDLINGDIKTLPDYLKQAAIETLKFGIFGGITGMVSKAGEKVTDINKAALFSAGKDPKAFLEALDQKVQAGTISPKDAEQVKQNVEKAAKVFDSVPMVNGKGKPLSEIEQRDLMFLKMQEADISETLKKDIPESLANKLGEKVVAIQDQMDKIYKGTYLEKAPLPKKEETPKPEEPKLTQPIEGQGGIVFKIGNLVTTKDGKQGEVAEIKDGKARIVIKGFDESGALPTRDLGWHDLNDLKAQKEGLDENSVPLPNKEIKSNWNYEGEGDAFSSNKDSRDGKSAYVIRVLDTNGRGSSYNRAKQRGELDIESPLTYDGDKESVSAIDGNGNTVGVIKLQTDGGIEHIVVAPEFARKGVATELVKQIESKGGKVIPEKSKQISPDASKFFNKLSETKKAQPIELSVEPKEENKTGLVLFHGSPHSFENFDITKLGSGEGNQAFGHGLYFTNQKDIANGYANKLSSKKNFWEALQNGNELSLSQEDFDFISNELDALGFDGTSAENSNIGDINVNGKTVNAPEVLEAMAIAFSKDPKASLKDFGLSDKEVKQFLDIKRKITDPQLYKVSVHEGKTPSEYDYIDWHDKLTDSQIKKIGIEIPKDATGQEAYKVLSKKLGGDKKASEYLLSKGIDGISYKSDKGTGGKTGEGRNYVVFDPKSISVKEINEKKQIVPIEKKNTGTEIEPQLNGGRKQVTLSGSTEEERQAQIKQRQKETKVTPLTEDRDKILERVAKFNALDKRGKSNSYEEINRIKIALDNFNKKHGQEHTITRRKNGDLEIKNNPTEKRPSGTPIKYSLKKAESNIVDNATHLSERSDKTKEVFKDLLDNGALPPAKDLNGNLFSDDQHNATIHDIQDGIPSQRAENYLNRLDEMIAKDRFDYGDKNPNAYQPTLKESLGIESEQHGKEMTPDEVHNWLNSDAALLPENQETFDNVDNLITHYEQQNEHPTEQGLSNKVQEPNSEATGFSNREVKPNEQAQEGNGKNANEKVVPNGKEKKAEIPNQEAMGGSDANNESITTEETGNTKAATTENIQPQQTALEKAKEARKEAKAKLDAIRKNLGVINDPFKKAEALVGYHKALVSEAKEHIKEGVKTVQDFAKAIGEKVTVALKTAWDEATGAIKPIKDADELKYDLDNLDLEAGGISKKSLKAEYGFVQDFPSRSDKEVATTAMDNLQEAADNNGVSIEQQAANEVALMKNKKGEASEHDIMVAAYHLRNLDEQIAKANKNNIDAEHLLNQREEALTALRQLGNNAGRNLRLFGNVYKKVEGGRLEVVRAELKRDLGVDDIPKTMIDLKLSKLSDADKKKVEPYVKAIEELNKTINDINTKATKATADIHSQEVQDYIDNEVAKRLKDQKPTTPKAREKKSQLFKDIAQRIRTENELEKFAKSAGGKEIHKNSIFGDVDFKELAAQAMDYLAKGVEKGEDLAELIKKASIKFKGKFDASEFGKALNTIVSKASLPDKDEVIGKIKDIAQNENANGITPDMVRHGLINDVVNHYIHSDTPTNSVIKEATKELKQHLPDVTEEQVQDAILRRGEFKPKTKQQLKNEISDKAAEVKKLATTQSDSRELGNGIRKETSNKSEIKIAKAAEDFINEIKNDDTLTDEVKKQHIKAVEEQRDADLANTRQGVLVNLKDAIDNHVSELTTKQNDAIVAGDKKTAEDLSEVKNDLQNLSKALSPNPEKLKDQIDKADQDLQAIIKSNEGTQIAKDLTDIQKEFHDNWQKTFDELEQQRLLNSAKQGQKEAERRLLAGQYTEIPTTPYEAKTNNILAQQEAATKRAWNKLNSLSIKAKEQKDKKGIVNKWLNTRRDIMIMSFGAIEKVAGSAVTKPFLDPLIKQTFGRLSGLITGVKPTALSRLGSTYRQLKNEASANEFMKKANNNYIDALVNHEKVVKEFGKDSEQAKKSFDKVQQAEINHLAALPYLFINAGSHVDIAQVITKGATDFDANIGKYQQSLAKERTKWEGTKFWLQSVNRTHAAMKSISHRQALIDHYIENLQHIQSKEGSVSNEARQHAWDVATLAAEEGRFGEKTKLSELIAGAKNSRSNWVKYPAKFLAPVAKISINITKQGIDMAFPFVESTAKTLGSNALKGVKLNKADGIEFKNFASKYYNGIKRGFDELPLQQKKYINTLISRGLFGVAQYALVGYALANGGMKFGGSYDSNDPYHKKKVLGSDGQPLDYDEWEMGGVRLPKLLNIVINHSPYSLPASLAAVTHDQLKSEDKKGMQIFHAFTKTANEVYHRLPFSTMVDVGKAAFGDEYKLENIVANEVPTMKSTAEYFDKTKEGEPREVDKGGTGFWNTTGKIIESKIPLVRNTLPTKTYGVKNYNEGGREITSEENANYESKKIEETNKQIDLLKRGERPENTFVKDGEKVTKKLDDMTPDEQTSAKTEVKKEVTEALKKQLFGDKPEKTPQEKQDENLQRSLRRQFYINKGEPIPDYLKDPESTPQ